MPQSTRVAKQLLPVFPELLEEVTVSWKDRPFSSRSPIQGTSSFEGMEKQGLLSKSPMELVVAVHLYQQLPTASSRSPTLPSKVDRFQSAMTERPYKVVAL